MKRLYLLILMLVGLGLIIGSLSLNESGSKQMIPGLVCTAFGLVLAILKFRKRQKSDAL